ncbi:urea carboxylase-associated family protein [Gilvimarinus agarilyticus]|uniref:urea amidolyase associated protein UAAP1 n=1 Tax=Gilvimarinus sp. 2_MG-2023 TaxID=3062666 RepID=UPI001C0936C4|nr:urea amidolyase associated protein UAAP1 [Gilvimarinus sp. 2_MG-2023]MBU2886509.1 urea carboxylase-associated family protein [Gilvimarinus agarilyticus]MDO6571177.1 urea carboxylase-associated family protein [Gilvimarinus sp. 2_MG-2023]
MNHYQTTIAPGGHWSLELRRGTVLRLQDLDGNGNAGVLFYNSRNLLERYNAPDTLKCQHTFKLTRGNCLYSDMGRIFASIIEDDLGWHDTVCGNSHASHIEDRWGARDYQTDRNDWRQNGYDAFLVEQAKYGLNAADLAANINVFSKVVTDSEGNMSLVDNHSPAGSEIALRIEMDCLVLIHACPHPLNQSPEYPRCRIGVSLGLAEPMTEEDVCLNHCDENGRGFANNALYHLGA